MRSPVARSGSGSNLDEARRAEVAVECQCFPEALPAHDDKTRGIDEGVDALVMTPEPGQRLALDALVDLHDGQPVRSLDRVEERDCRRVSVATAQEGPGLADDVVRRRSAWPGAQRRTASGWLVSRRRRSATQ